MTVRWNKTEKEKCSETNTASVRHQWHATEKNPVKPWIHESWKRHRREIVDIWSVAICNTRFGLERNYSWLFYICSLKERFPFSRSLNLPSSPLVPVEKFRPKEMTNFSWKMPYVIIKGAQSRYFELFWASTKLPLNWRRPENNTLQR